MQRGIWTLAITGTMALYQSGYAADPVSSSSDSPSGRSSVGTARVSAPVNTNRTVKKPKTTNKNYYKDLFAEDELTPATTAKRKILAAPPAKTNSDDWDDDTLTDGSKATAKASNKKENNFDEDVDELPAVTEKSATENTGKAATENTGKPKVSAAVTHATYSRNSEKKNSVQQIRNERRPRSAPPVIGSDEVAEKAKRKESLKESVKESIANEAFEEAIESEPKPVESISVQTGPQTPQVTVEWIKHGELNVGQECLVDLIVRNTGAAAVSQVAIDAILPTTVRLTAAEPRPASATDRLTWTFEQLAPAGEKKITIKLVPSERGEIGATAEVRFTGVSTAAFSVSEPLLKVSLKAPSKEIMIGDPASQMISVNNPGTGTVHDVKIEAKLSDGLEHPTREDRLMIDVGAVGPGETRTFRLPLAATKGGSQSVSVVATSSSDVSSTDSVEFNVISPSLKVTVDGPSLRYKGRNAKYALTVTNDGSVVNNNIHVSQAIADGFRFVSADHNGKYDPSIKSIHWFVGRLEPGDSVQINCELQSLQIGEFAHQIQVVSDTGVQADARIETRVDGIASLTMELVDLDDPVETGSETGYEIRVKNDGSKVASAVTVTCELPAGMDFLSAKAPVGQAVDGRQLTFKPIEQIAPGGQVTIRVLLKVNRDGSHRMRVRLTGGGLQDPIVLEEVTRAYSDGSN